MNPEMITLINEHINLKYLNPTEENINEYLSEIAYTEKESIQIDTMIETIRETIGQNQILNNELEQILNALPGLKDDCVREEVEEMKENLRQGYVLSENQIYRREFFPVFPNQEMFFLNWSIKKAQNIIKKNKLPKTYFPIIEMNIDKEELDQETLKAAIHNKKPSFLVSYHPFRQSRGYHFLIDGNHRAAANENRGHSEHRVYILESLQTMEALNHDYFKAFYLLHIMLTDFHRLDLMDDHEFQLKLDLFKQHKSLISF